MRNYGTKIRRFERFGAGLHSAPEDAEHSTFGFGIDQQGVDEVCVLKVKPKKSKGGQAGVEVVFVGLGALQVVERDSQVAKPGRRATDFHRSASHPRLGLAHAHSGPVYSGRAVQGVCIERSRIHLRKNDMMEGQELFQ